MLGNIDKSYFVLKFIKQDTKTGFEKSTNFLSENGNFIIRKIRNVSIK